MTAVRALPSLRQRQERKLQVAAKERDDELDLEDVPDDLIQIGNHDLIVAWFLKQGLREGDDEEPPAPQ